MTDSVAGGTSMGTTATGTDDVEAEITNTISKLAKEKGWLHEQLLEYQGFYFPEPYLRKILIAQHQQQPFTSKPSDVVLACFPKSGTTWLKALVFSIVNHRDSDPSRVLASSPHKLVPFLEESIINDDSQSMTITRRIFGTHSPITCLAPSVLQSSPGCKMVYICRDPKDVLVSQWHFTSKLRTSWYQGTVPPLSLQEAVELFCRGVSPFGPFWDHVLGYWKASLEMPERVLFLKYEDIKRDPVLWVHKLSHHLDCPFASDEEAKIVVDLCSFESLSNAEGVTTGMFKMNGFDTQYDVFFRRGEAGDWRNHLTPEMADRVDQVTRRKLDASGLIFL